MTPLSSGEAAFFCAAHDPEPKAALAQSVKRFSGTDHAQNKKIVASRSIFGHDVVPTWLSRFTPRSFQSPYRVQPAKPRLSPP
jgi:hypothetical protein